MAFILDISAYSAFNRGDKRLKKWFNSGDDIIVPSIIVGELRAGFAAGNKRKENEALLQRFLDSPNVIVATITDDTTRLYAHIYLSLRKLGKPIGTNDMWIAAIAIELNIQLLALDSDFEKIPDLMLGAV